MCSMSAFVDFFLRCCLYNEMLSPLTPYKSQCKLAKIQISTVSMFFFSFFFFRRFSCECETHRDRCEKLLVNYYYIKWNLYFFAWAQRKWCNWTFRLLAKYVWQTTSNESFFVSLEFIFKKFEHKLCVSSNNSIIVIYLQNFFTPLSGWTGPKKKRTNDSFMKPIQMHVSVMQPN